MQRVCQDKVFPYIVFFAKGGGRTGTEPIRAYILTFFIAVACIAIGRLSITLSICLYNLIRLCIGVWIACS